VVFYHILTTIHIPYALGFSIILLTALIKLILYPLTASQLKTSKKMQQLTPHLNKIKEKHKGDNQRIQVETMALYKEHGVNPAAGCLPMLIQLPIIWGLYAVLRMIVGTNSLKQINQLIYVDSLKLKHVWDPSFFGLPLGKSPADLLSHTGFLILLIPILTGLFQFIQSKMTFSSAPQEAVAPEEKKEKKPESDFAQAFQTQSLFLLPVMIGFFSFRFQIGLSLYWNTFTIFGIIQQYQIHGLGGLKDWMKKKDAPVVIDAKPIELPKKGKKNGK
jgi:YidC/Oxa1 family membrane protein insertase